ncbi:hypothetical protein L6164_016895 [Bauhinia variegata]|uniref:Uncharacterized protein n=1 Tax=Bauhinia variegata TaxID=167791 RepID=A0ACB9N9U4_BAUVA|nr:hypothetical protein L6164_016895 [Bauhinia variegata]
MDSDAANEKPSLGDDYSQDIISTLPEEILSHILSFLATIDAVRTSVLSKNWIYKWTSITNLDVDDKLLYSVKSRTSKAVFINFMNRVLSHIQSSRINNVSLRFSKFKNKASVLNSWISAVLNKGVQKLNIEYLYEDHPLKQLDFVLPYSFFKSETLIELKLKLSNCIIRVPSGNILSNVRILKITLLNFVSNSLSESKQIILRFPVLKDFHMEYCTWLNVRNVSFDAPQLENFSASAPKFGWRDDDARNSVINILALNLRKFSYRGYLTHGLILSKPTSVMDAYLNICKVYWKIDDTWQKTGLRACKLLTAFQNLKFLKLGYETVRAMTHESPQVSTLPLFGSLVSLDIEMNFLSISQNMLFILLHKSPVLERLCLCLDPPNSSEDFLTSMEVPHCFTSSLKLVEFSTFFYEEMPSLSLPIYVLQNTTLLKRMTVKIKAQFKTRDMKNIIEEVLLSSPKASKIASVAVQEIFY